MKIAECIAQWSEIETILGLLLAMLLDSNAKAALAMYAALENRAAQMRMLDAGAKSVLPEAHYEVVAAILLGFVRPSMRERDKLAHWCWGYSSELPNDLILMEPDEKMALNLSVVMGPWPAPGSEDTKFGVTMGPEVQHGGEAAVYARVQA